MLGHRRYCYPLTITDFASRYLLTCEALSTTQERFAFTVFERTFKHFGLPHVIGPTTASRLRPPTPSMGSANSRSGGSAWASQSNASNPDSRNKTAATNGCI